MNKVLVTPENAQECIIDLCRHRVIGLDTETYGLALDKDLFSIQLAIGYDFQYTCYYINFHDYKDGTYVWDAQEFRTAFRDVFYRNDDPTWAIHNAKFDLHKLHRFALDLSGNVHCTQAIERIIYNQHMAYSLDACLKRHGLGKNKEVEKWISANKAFTWIDVEGKKKRVKDKHYDRVPFDIMFEYGCDDAADALFLFDKQQIEFICDKDLEYLIHTEYELTRTCQWIEQTGIKIDLDYVKKGMEYEQGRTKELIAEATRMAGTEYKGGPKWLRSAFDKFGQPYDLHPKTSNPIFDKAALGKMQSPIAGLVKDIRRSEKYVGTYYSSFDYFNIDSVLHANIRQAGTDTGRFSYSDPNLQNVPKEEEFAVGSIQVRKCFVPRDWYCFTMIDFDQQEFRLMLDYAGEHQLIKNIMEHGLDVHQATADMCGISRKNAKTLNFGLLYGMGTGKLANALKLSEADAYELKATYFGKLPKVKAFIRDVIKAAENRKYIKTWTGRKLHFPKKDFCYKAPNHLIQGGCGDIARVAMNRLQDELGMYQSQMLVQVHDEILFEIHENEFGIVPDLVKIMEDVYSPRNRMKLTCGVEHSFTSWGKQDVIEGAPCVGY